ncbi:MAG: hypothetical protein QOG53_3209 [Frankiales bacterium]|jgi:hypothetical protein|nr:hypothetical protein [Frankiales bacterium]
MTFKRTVTTEIEAPLHKVFELISDGGRQPEWSSHRPTRVIASAPPSRFVCECSDDSGAYLWTFDLTSSPIGTTVHHTVQRLSAPAFIKVIQPLAWEMFGERQVVGGLAKLKALAESHGIPLPRQSTSHVWDSASR